MVVKIGELIQQKNTEQASKGDTRSLGEQECKECGVVVQDFVQECIAPDFGLWYPYFAVCPECLARLEKGEEEPPPIDVGTKLENDFLKICPPEMQETDASRLNQSIIQKVLAQRLEKKGILMHGQTGTGKTRIMWLLIRELIVSRGMSVKVYNSGELKERMIEANRNSLSLKDMMSDLLSCNVLCIDDLGKEKMTDAWKELLFNVIDKRTLYHRPMVITTNYRGSSFSELFTDKNMADPIIRRLRDFFIDISM